MTRPSPPDADTPAFSQAPSLELACHAHDQNNLLQVAACLLEVLERRTEGNPTTSRKVQELRAVIGSLQDMNRIVLTAFQASRADLRLWPLDPDHALEKIVALAGSFNQKGVDIALRTGPSKALVPIQEVHLEQVVLNLLKNAVEAAPSSGGRVVVESRVLPQGGRDLSRRHRMALHITITDNGRGIPPHVRDHLFAEGTTSKRDGHGLGLHYARRILSHYGGSIRVEGSRESGTQATVVWPLE